MYPAAALQNPNPAVTDFALVLNENNPTEVHLRVAEAWEQAGGRTAITAFLTGSGETRDLRRERTWAAVMGGASVLDLDQDGISGSEEELRDVQRLNEFLGTASRTGLVPRDDLASSASTWVLADPGETYVLYDRSDESDSLGLRSIPRGVYRLDWFDPETGVYVLDSTWVGVEGLASWEIPEPFRPEVALRVSRMRAGMEVVFPGPTWEAHPQSRTAQRSPLLGPWKPLIGGDGCVVKSGFMLGCWGDPPAEETGPRPQNRSNPRCFSGRSLKGEFPRCTFPLLHWGGHFGIRIGL